MADVHSRAGKVRLDVLMTARALVPSRERAQALILAGRVLVNEQKVDKPGAAVAEDAAIRVLGEEQRYVSRGGLKLEAALEHWKIALSGRACLDVGASTGGFTDCLLQQGAVRVYAVDVGSGQLAWKLRQDPRVVVLEKTNARALTPARMPPPFAPVDLAVIDCSFISLRKILPAAVALVRDCGSILALVKPQFEAGRREADRGRGVITDPAIHARVLQELQAFVSETGSLAWRGSTESPLRGPAGNKEFFIALEKVR